MVLHQLNVQLEQVTLIEDSDMDATSKLQKTSTGILPSSRVLSKTVVALPQPATVFPRTEMLYSVKMLRLSRSNSSVECLTSTALSNEPVLYEIQYSVMIPFLCSFLISSHERAISVELLDFAVRFVGPESGAGLNNNAYVKDTI